MKLAYLLCMPALAVFLWWPIAVAAEEQQLGPVVEDSHATSASPDERVCAFRTHDCELCSADRLGHVTCSSVGFACQPKVWRCLYYVPETGKEQTAPNPN